MRIVQSHDQPEDVPAVGLVRLLVDFDDNLDPVRVIDQSFPFVTSHSGIGWSQTGLSEQIDAHPSIDETSHQHPDSSPGTFQYAEFQLWRQLGQILFQLSDFLRTVETFDQVSIQSRRLITRQQVEMVFPELRRRGAMVSVQSSHKLPLQTGQAPSSLAAVRAPFQVRRYLGRGLAIQISQ